MGKKVLDARKTVSSSRPNKILAPVSIGELIDKITILEIKAERMNNPVQRHNVQQELDALRSIDPGDIDNEDVEALRKINAKLWEVEDAIREHESHSDFGTGFVELARSVYKLNDVRAALKKKINLSSGSLLIEEKSYFPVLQE